MNTFLVIAGAAIGAPARFLVDHSEAPNIGTIF
jgi:fluoride ion exporter CrcB/FEX